jgi:hypothetical protein
MTTLQETFDKLIEEQKALRAKFQETAQSLFKETTKQFFDNNPAVTAIHWTQYTPYFNDGETCVFSVGEVYFTNANSEQMEDITRWGEYEGEDEEVWSETSWGFKYHKDKNYEGVNLDDVAKFSALVSGYEMQEVMQEMFGDHVRVIASRAGFDIDECDHD